MEGGQSRKERVSSAEAVMLGALALASTSGPTWNTLKMAFVMLGVCLAAMLGLAFSFSDSSLIFHVTFLVLIAATLFLLLSSFLAETGLVSVEHQMQEMGLGKTMMGMEARRAIDSISINTSYSFRWLRPYKDQEQFIWIARSEKRKRDC